MLKRMTLAAAAIALTSPAMATCLEGRTGAQCDLLLEDYRNDEVPVGTTLVWPDRDFAIEGLNEPAVGTWGDDILRDDVLVRDGDDVFLVPDVSGPPIKIADW